jgi:hypothetical protein
MTASTNRFLPAVAGAFHVLLLSSAGIFGPSLLNSRWAEDRGAGVPGIECAFKIRASRFPLEQNPLLDFACNRWAID